MTTADELLKQARNHLALIGKFTIEDDADNRVKTFLTSEFKEKREETIKFELRYSPTPLKIDGLPYEAYRIFSPRDAIADTVELPISRTPLEQALGRPEPGQGIADVGGKLYGDSLKAIDAVAPFWHPAFDRLLTEGYWHYTQLRTLHNETFTDGTRRDLLYSAPVNRALLAYLRARDSDVKDALIGVDTALTNSPILSVLEGAANLRELLLIELKDYRKRLAEDLPGTNPLHERVENKSSWKEWVKDQGIPRHAGKSVSELYRAFRSAAEPVENISRCEPLIALMIMWYFRKITKADTSRDIAEAVYKEVYENDKTWRPRLSPQQQGEDQEAYRKGMNAQYAALVVAERDRGGENSPKAIVFKLFMRFMIEHRGETWLVSNRYTKDALIQDTTRRFQALAAQLIEGVEELFGRGRAVLDNFKGVYQNFEAQYADPKGIKEALTKIIANLPAETFGEWRETFQKEHDAKEGHEFADAFRASFNTQVAMVTGATATEFFEKHGAKVEAELNLVGTIYRTQLKGAVDKRGAIAPAGSLAGVRDDRLAERANPVSHGAETEYQQVMKGTAGGLPEKETAKPVDAPAAAADGGKEPENATPQAPPAGRFEMDFSEAELGQRCAEIQVPDTTDDLTKFAKVLDHFDGVVESVRKNLMTESFLKDAAKAPARGTLWSTLLGEFLLTAPGEVSPMEKKHSSLGVALLLGMIESVGASAAYEGKNRPSLTRAEPDLKCGVRDAGLPSIWQISKGEDGKKQLEGLITYWSKLASEVFSVREYIADMNEANQLLDALSECRGGQVTFINDTVEGHVASVNQKRAERDLFCSVSQKDKFVPPSVVYVSRQACDEKVASLKPISDALMGKQKDSLISRLHEVNAKDDQMGRWVSLPTFVAGRPLDADGLPLLAVEIPEAFLLAAYLSNFECNALKKELGAAYRDLETALTGEGTLGKKTKWAQLWKKYVLANPIDLLTSKIITHALFQRCLGITPAASAALFGGVDDAKSLIGEEIAVSLQIPGEAGAWRDLPTTKNAFGNMPNAVLAVKQTDGEPKPIQALQATFARV